MDADGSPAARTSMTIYGEFDAQFRKKPAVWRTLLVAFSSAMIGTVLVSLLMALAIGALGRTRETFSSALVLFAPPVPVSSLLFDAAVSTLPSFPIGAAVASLLIAFGLVFFWPANPNLATQLFLAEVALAFLAFGALFTAAESILIRRSYLREPRQVALEAGIAVIAVLFTVAAERKIIAVLANLVAMASPSRRLLLWLIRIGLPFGLLGAAGWWVGSHATAIGAGIVVAITFLENLVRRPSARFVQLRDVQMNEAAAALPLLAILLVAGTLWISDSWNGTPDRAVVWTGGSEFGFATLDEARRISGLSRPAPRESVIRMEWSGQSPEADSESPAEEP